MKQNWTFK